MGTKDIVEEVCKYYIEKCENADRPKRKNRSASSAGVNDEHKIIIGVCHKCEAESSLYTLKVIFYHVKSLSAKNTKKIMPKCHVQLVRMKS